MKLLVVDDHEIVRKGLVSVLSRDPAVESVEEAANAAEAIRKAGEYRPDVVILDGYLDGQSGAEVCRELLGHYFNLKIMMLSSSSDEKEIYEAIGAGARGFVLKDVDSAKLLHQIEVVKDGGVVFDQKIYQRIVQMIQNGRNGKMSNQGNLTEREINIVHLIAKGFSNRQIAHSMYLSENTVKSHIQNIMRKMAVSNRVEVINEATRIGILN